MRRPHLLIDVPLAAVGSAALIAGCGWWPLAAAAGITAGIHAWATVHPRSSLYLPVHWRLPRGEPGIALTFDDGPHGEHTPAVLDCLAAHQQRATFFVIGEHAQHHGALLRRMRAEGHAVGLHSHRHSRWFNCWPPNFVRRDLIDCAAAVADATGEAPPTLFRPPVGLKNPIVADVVHGLGLTTVTWSGRAWDTRDLDAERIARATLRAALPGAIVLLHDGHEPRRPGDRSATVAALARVLPQLAARNLRSGALCNSGDGIKLELHGQRAAAAG